MPVSFRPSPASAPVYLPASETWIMSRYADVSCALSAPELSQSHIVDPGSEGAAHAALKAAVQADIERLSGEEWNRRAEDSLDQLFGSASTWRRGDLLADVIHPWTTGLIVDLNSQPGQAKSITRISRELLLAAGTNSKQRQSAADQAIDRMIRAGTLTLSKSMFFGFTQTLSSYLSKSWLALLLHSEQCEQLLANPTLAGNATEELLRYAGVVHTIRRTANADVRIGSAYVRRGQTVMLEVDSANFDPVRFDNPHQLDFARRGGGHLALGRGLHACVGSYLVRMASCVAIPKFVQARLMLDSTREVTWTGDRTLLWPLVVPVTLRP